MKRRNAEIGKMRRPMKRNKIAEGICGSGTLLYLKFLMLWVIVILADFILEFRFEFLWPFYLLLRSVYDSFKYQGLAFSIFFVCVALTSDMLCFFFIPMHWLFFAASTYVWVQYVWHTDKGICAPTIILWILFVYLEAAIRLKEVKHMPSHVDLCRPFAAHCIGYPVVTLGFGFKSYVGYRIRLRRQREVAKENEFYMQLMQEALPEVPEAPPQDPSSAATVISTANHISNINNNTTSSSNNSKVHKAAVERNGHLVTSQSNGTVSNGVQHRGGHRKAIDKCKDNGSKEHHNNTSSSHSHTNGSATAIGAEAQQQQQQHDDVAVVTTTTTTTAASGSPGSCHHQDSAQQQQQQQQQSARSTAAAAAARRREKREQEIKEREAAEYLQKLETDARRLRMDLQSAKASEQELRLQVAALTTTDKVSKGEISSMQREIEDLQQRLHGATSSRNSDKQTIGNLERRVADERRMRGNLESQLNQERKSRKQEEARAAQVVAQSTRGECTEACRARRRELEADLLEVRTKNHWTEERYAAVERENAALHEQLRDTEILMGALSAMQEKNAHLENSLSAETRIKLDLFSALGEAKRQLEIRESSNRTHEREIEELKSKIAQVVAVMPNDSFPGASMAPPGGISRVRLAESPPGSTLDPNATAYTPKGSLVAASTEA